MPSTAAAEKPSDTLVPLITTDMGIVLVLDRMYCATPRSPLATAPQGCAKLIEVSSRLIAVCLIGVALTILARNSMGRNASRRRCMG